MSDNLNGFRMPERFSKIQFQEIVFEMSYRKRILRKFGVLVETDDREDFINVTALTLALHRSLGAIFNNVRMKIFR